MIDQKAKLYYQGECGATSEAKTGAICMTKLCFEISLFKFPI